MLWTAIIVASIGCYGLKLAGLSMPSRTLDKPFIQEAAIPVPVATYWRRWRSRRLSPLAGISFWMHGLLVLPPRW